MKYKPTSKKATIIIVVIAIIAIVAAKGLGFATTRSATRIGYSGNEGWSSWSGAYISLDGTMQKSIHPKDDTLHIEVTTESGMISIEIKDADGNIVFGEENIGTDSFDVKVSGKVIVKINADNHKGEFSIE